MHNPAESTSEIVLGVYMHHTRAAFLSIYLRFELTDNAEAKWATTAYQQLREAAERAHLARRQTLEARLTRLRASLSDVNALTLRKLEREEIMKAVLRWLFGHHIDFALPVDGPLVGQDGRILSEALQGPVLEHGRVVSFLHQAVEWENVNSFLYPYFWTAPSSWDLRLRLRHKDAIHEAFLRAGACRVVLPVRPGYERAFLAFLESGDPDATLVGGHPYMTIAEEIENFAKTNYPGIVPANPETVDPQQSTEAAEGRLVGSWFEYTPTSALDIQVGSAAPSEGTFLTKDFQPDGFWARMTPLIQAATGVLQAAAKRLGGEG